MMKLFVSFSGFKSKFQSPPQIFRVLSVFFYSTEALTSPSSPSNDSLYSRISLKGDPRVSIVPILEQWVEEGNKVDRGAVRRIVNQLRSYKRFRHALDTSQWISDRRFFDPSPGDIVIRLDLISKVHDLKKAEEYFDNIPKQFKGPQIYTALLNCYCHSESVEKAEALMQKMRELRFAKDPQSYNALLNLYSKTGQHEKLDTLMKEMKEKGMDQEIFTLTIRLGAYADTADIDGMETFLQKMEADPKVIMTSSAYLTVSKGYIKAGLVDKALEMLKKAETSISGKKRRITYESLLNMYAGLGKKDEVYRIWNLYESSEKFYNRNYLSMLRLLVKLDDIAGVEKIFQEWKSESSNSYDYQILNFMSMAYSKSGLLDKAEIIIQNITKKGKKPNPSSWVCLAAGFVKADRLPEAVEAMKKAVLVSHPGSGWKPDSKTLLACLKYLKEEENYEKINEFAKLSGIPVSLLTDDDCDGLKKYLSDEKHESGAVNKMDRDVFDDSEYPDVMEERSLESSA